MKKLILMVGLLVTLPSFAGVSANVGITSDYIWRGMTQSDGISVSGHLRHGRGGSLRSQRRRRRRARERVRRRRVRH